MNSRLFGLPGQKRIHFLHSRSMYDLPRQAIPPSHTYHPAYAYPTRPVSFCPISTPEPLSLSTSNRRLSELPTQLDLGFPFGSLLDDNFSLAKGYSPDCNSREALSNPSHRYGTSSSSGLSERAILSIENSSSVCTAPTSPIDSDRSSIYECAALDFPEPPPIGSPVIRRMRSSPWFLSADEVDGVTLDRLRRQPRMSSMGLKAESIKPNNFGYPKENPLGFYNGDVTRGINNHDTRGEAFRLQSHRRKSAFLDMKPTQSEKYLQQHDFQSGEKKDNPKAVPRTELSSTSFGHLPRIIRKVASMRSDSHRTQETADVPNASAVTFQRPVPRVRSFRSILPGSENDEVPRTNFRQDSRQLNKRTFFWAGQASKTRTEMDAEKDRHRRQSTSHMVYENNLPGKSSTTLGPSFKQGTSWKNDLNKSFIDISPDRSARPKGRGKERMKLLLSKANELFSWGRFQRKATLPQGSRHR